jgi:hypothetical protein
MSGKEFTGKIRRHTYSMADLRIKAAAKAEARPHDLYETDPGADDGLDYYDWMNREGNFEAYLQIANGWVNWPLHMLPADARVVSFHDLAMELAADPRGYSLLTGADRTAAGLENFRVGDWGDQIGAAFSFCVNGKTYTAFENPNDGYRSSMGRMIERDGNHCQSTFEPCALLPQFRRTTRDWDDDDAPRDPKDPKHWTTVPPGDERAGHADLLDLIDPKSREPALSVGTQRGDDYYPSFVGYLNPERLQSARAQGIAESFALADELHAGLLSLGSKRKARL